MSAEFDFEPVRGLPQRLPEGETILWQGAPSVMGVAGQVFHVRAVGIYFAAMALAFAASAAMEGAGPAAIVGAALAMVPVAAAGLGLLFALAFMNARTTVYTVTNKRVVMRLGAALTKAINIPFRLIAAADLKAGRDASADIALTLSADARIPYLHLWPHVQPFSPGDPRPSFRALRRADADAAARILGEALRAFAAGAAVAAQTPSPAPARPALQPPQVAHKALA